MSQSASSANAAANSSADTATGSDAVGCRSTDLRPRIAQSRHIGCIRELHLWSRHDARLRREFRMIVAGNHNRWHDLPLGNLGQFALGRLYFCLLTAASAASHRGQLLRSRWHVDGNIRSNERDMLLLGLVFHHSGAHYRERHDPGKPKRMEKERDRGGSSGIAISSPRSLDRDRPRGQLQRRKLNRKEEVSNVILQRLQSRFLDLQDSECRHLGWRSFDYGRFLLIW